MYKRGWITARKQSTGVVVTDRLCSTGREFAAIRRQQKSVYRRVSTVVLASHRELIAKACRHRRYSTSARGRWEESLKRGRKRGEKRPRIDRGRGSESSSLIRSAARMNFSRISRATRNSWKGWKSENRSTKNCTPCRPRLNINYSPCSTANAGLFVESFVGKKRVTTSGIRLSGRARSFRDIKKKKKGNKNEGRGGGES